MSGCWIWAAYVDPGGYGRFSVVGQSLRAHRITYRALVGPIPDGREIDHRCRVRACCNPLHLEAVSHRENLYRGMAPAAINRRRAHCKRGHELTIATRSNGPGRVARYCVVCASLQAQARKKVS